MATLRDMCFVPQRIQDATMADSFVDFSQAPFLAKPQRRKGAQRRNPISLCGSLRLGDFA
ncbi:hypothetical protein SBA3_4490007 [Candidatus Sulfopaludibacter sp. SbA3]|nr:hypothetical protein SBA3_4490007 [Candidatus Sulfopaludibacter sp. SbA3]